MPHQASGGRAKAQLLVGSVASVDAGFLVQDLGRKGTGYLRQEDVANIVQEDEEEDTYQEEP